MKKPEVSEPLPFYCGERILETTSKLRYALIGALTGVLLSHLFFIFLIALVLKDIGLVVDAYFKDIRVILFHPLVLTLSLWFASIGLLFDTRHTRVAKVVAYFTILGLLLILVYLYLIGGFKVAII